MTEFETFVGDAGWSDVSDPADLEKKLRESYPGVDILLEAKRARLWEENSGAKKRNHGRFLTNWVRRASARFSARSTSPQQTGNTSQRKPEEFSPEWFKQKDEAEKRAKLAQEQTKEYIQSLKTIKTTPKQEALNKCREILKKLD